MLEPHVLERIHIPIVDIDMCPSREVNGLLVTGLPVGYG